MPCEKTAVLIVEICKSKACLAFQGGQSLPAENLVLECQRRDVVCADGIGDSDYVL